MEITDEKLLRIALITALIGIIGLIILTPSIEVKKISIKDITRSMIDEKVSIQGVITDISQSSSKTSYFLTINDGETQITLIIFEKQVAEISSRNLNIGDFKNKKVVSILSGGNMDVITMSSVVQHGLIQRGRIFTVSVLLPDKPGELVKVASVIADKQGNCVRLEHNQFVTTNRNSAVELRITIEAYGNEHKQEIVQALEEKGYRPKLVNASL